jgi:hypothetical protein
MRRGIQGVPRRSIGSVILALALIVGLMAIGPAAAADTPRYQLTDYTLTVTSVNGVTTYTHTFWIHLTPCTGAPTGSGHTSYNNWNETVSTITLVNGVLSFKAVYPSGYTWYPSFTLNANGTLSFHDGHGPDNVTTATGTWKMARSTYRNHGQYVAFSVHHYGFPDAHSCIGMPMRHTKNK